MDTTTIKTLYVFVEIAVDRAHLAATVRLNFPACIPSPSAKIDPKGKGPELAIEVESSACACATDNENEERTYRPTKLALVGTIQFVAAVQGLKGDLEAEAEDLPQRLAIDASPSERDELDTPKPVLRRTAPRFEAVVPQVKPLSPGEILGCTAPRLPPDTDALL